MRELMDILDAFDALATDGRRLALATVAAVEGPSYRRPGARMLIAPDGRTWGGISGGCLEKDVARRARIVADTGVAAICRYETGGNDHDIAEGSDAPAPGEPGAALGCGGAIEILIEPVTAQESGPLAAIKRVVRQRETHSLATVFRVGGPVEARVGDRLFSDATASRPLSASLRDLLQQDLQETMGLTTAATPRRHVLRDGWIDVLIEHLRPPPALVIFGEGNDVNSLLEIAGTLGWHTIVVGTKSRDALQSRLPRASRIISCSDDGEAAGILEDDALVLVMTHDYRRDVATLRRLAQSPPRYVGVLGPRSRTDRMLESLGLRSDPLPHWLHAPVGLDIGADTPQAIALSIICEIQAVLAGRTGGFLRHRNAPIYDAAFGERNAVAR